jgi:hypothetical protein
VSKPCNDDQHHECELPDCPCECHDGEDDEGFWDEEIEVFDIGYRPMSTVDARRYL